MSIREGRSRPHRDYPLRSEGRSHHGRGNNPPSRHLWVGNLSHNLTESILAHHFLQFGDLESIAFQPGRSYAFINYRNEKEAFAAVKELQGFVIAGNPIRIEFAKPEKSLVPPRDESFPISRESPFSHRGSRARHFSPELLHPNKSKMNDKDAEPSEVLWVGFPAELKMDEFVLRKAFSPFGEIEKITAFPGRTYAFVRFRNVTAACRAKDTLHRKLLGNPRVHICFAKNESGPSHRERISINAPPSPPVRSYGQDESCEHFLRSGRNFGTGDHRIRSPPFIPNLDPRDPNVMDLARNANVWQRRFPGHRFELGLPGDIYEPVDSPKRNMGAHIRDFSPQKFPRQGPIYDDPWDLPEDVSLLHGTKKLKTNNTFPPDNELPEYPLSDLEKAKHIVPRDIPQSGVLDKNYDSRHSGSRPVPQHLMNTAQTFGERGDHWNSSHDDFQVGSVQLPYQDRRSLTPERRQSSSKEVWKWEGMIAKGGTSVCRARCFPVGKPPDMVLPEYLDCTARTSLGMLAKHYYQAASAWVVFFAPANDPDISYYNEFMNYLGEKQRAAVVKLDERTTLFLVPPSEFSEKVLKVPGKLSISGVVLRLQTPGSGYRPIPQNENRETSFSSFHGDLVHQKPVSPSGAYLPTLPSTNHGKPGINVAPIHGNPSSGAVHSIANMQSVNAQGHDYVQKPAPGPSWSHHDFENPRASSLSPLALLNPLSKNITSHAPNMSYSVMPRRMQEAIHSSYTPDNNISGYLPSGSSKLPVPDNPQISVAGVPAEQLAQLASSLLGQQGQLGGVSSSDGYKPSGNINQSGHPFKMSQNYGVPNDQVPSEFAQSQFGQMQQQSPSLASSQANQQPQFQNPEQEDAEADPQKRLQATLQLAAALLQQIQQGKGT